MAFIIHEYEEPAKTGQYDEQVQALLDANEKSGKSMAIDIQVPAAEVNKHKRAFQISAKNYDRTGRAINERPQEDGSVVIEFILVDRIERKPKPATETSENTPTAA